jgi:WD40 repeat protein
LTYFCFSLYFIELTFIYIANKTSYKHQLLTRHLIPTIRTHFNDIFVSVPSVITGGENGVVKLWNIGSNVCEQIFASSCKFIEESSIVLCLALTADRLRLLSGNASGYASVWNLRSCRQLLYVKCHPDSILCLAAGPDQFSFVTGSKDCTLKLWRFDEPRQPVLSFIGHTGPVQCVVVTTRRAYSGGEDCTIRVWNVTTGHLLATLSHAEGISSIAFFQNVLVSGSCDGRVKLWHTNNILDKHSDSVSFVAITAGSRVVSVCRQNKVCVWDLTSGITSRECQLGSGITDSSETMKVSCSGAFVASVSGDMLHVQDLDSCLRVALSGFNGTSCLLLV